MLNRFARALFARIFTPIARLLVQLGISPDVVTLVGTLGVAAGALVFYPQGRLFAGTMVITGFVFSDIIDGLMARMTQRSSKWGAFLDSTLDRVGDAAVFGGFALYYVHVHDQLGIVVALLCLTLGSVVSYARARAEGLGMKADVGIAERSDRLVSSLLAAGFCGVSWGFPNQVLLVVLTVLAAASLVTAVQRILYVRSQAFAQAAADSAATADTTTAADTAAAPSAAQDA
jgi:CDP-diacylglycerol--glycerol-3-phosphate 3-phosphatidyltransferase